MTFSSYSACVDTSGVNWESVMQEYEGSTFMTEIGRPFLGQTFSRSKGACQPIAQSWTEYVLGPRVHGIPQSSQRRALIEHGRPQSILESTQPLTQLQTRHPAVILLGIP